MEFPCPFYPFLRVCSSDDMIHFIINIHILLFLLFSFSSLTSTPRSITSKHSFRTIKLLSGKKKLYSMHIYTFTFSLFALRTLQSSKRR